jgi:hypothetical protein
MVKNNENLGFDIDSKFIRVLLIIVTVLLIFAGPTYVPYLLSSILDVGSVATMVAGFTLFIVGLLLMLFLIRKKIIT